MSALDLNLSEQRLAAATSSQSPAALAKLLHVEVPALIAVVRQVQALTEDDIAKAIVSGSRYGLQWDRMTGQEQEWVRQQARPVLALIFGAEQDAADVVEFPGPVEFDFTPGGGDAA